MAGDTSAEVWLNTYRWSALREALKEEDAKIENCLQEYLLKLYEDKVPLEQRQQIDQLIAEEDMANEQYREAHRQFSAYRIRWDGVETFVESASYQNAASAASVLRKCIREKTPVTAAVFYGSHFEIRAIDADLFARRAADYQAGNTKIHGVIDIDMDQGAFSFVVRGEGWQRYPVKDAAAAAYSAFRNPRCKDQRALEIFMEKLQGKELPPPTRRLTAEDISFSDEISEIMDGKLNFYMDVVFDPDRVFGTHVGTADNGDWLNVYANYDVEKRRVCDTLDVILHRENGRDEELSYQLNPAEKDLLAAKMDAYCMARERVSLEEFCTQLQSGQEEAPNQGMAPLQ